MCLYSLCEVAELGAENLTGRSMASIVVDLLLSRIASALDSEARLIAGVGDELTSLQQELLWMKSFLEDAHRRNTSFTETQRRWVDQVTDMAHSSEDIIDDFMYHVSSQPDGPKFAKLFYATVGFPKNLWKKRQIARKLQKMRKKITEARERKDLYLEDRSEGTTSLQLQEQQRVLLQNYSESSLFFKDEELVGTEDGRDKLVGWLTTDADPQRTVISVVGIGGSGKTTLVASVYKHQDVKRHFDCWAWITVSQTYHPHDLLKTMIKEFHRAENQQVAMELSSMTHRELVETLVNYLRHKRYLVVLDDIWDVNLWSQISISLPDEGHGSRVLITTRKQNVASSSFGVKSHVHPVKPLENSKAWELFCMKAFPTAPNKTCPQPLQTIAFDLVAKCQGLPLAIVALGGLMASKNLIYSEWRQVLDDFTWELSNNPTLERVKIVLSLSFHDLSYHLKCCFLYCCLFPEDYNIDQEKLKTLWMAEGFVEKVRGTRPEDIAHRYLRELVDRNMLQRYMMESHCNMHDVLREFALHLSIKDKFCAIHDGRDAIEEINGARRLSIQSTAREVRSWNMNMIYLRTLLAFPKDMETLPCGLKLLRVLDLEHVPIVKLPDELVNLFNLRYLNLRETRVKELPKSIGRLRNLQTLNTINSNIRVLPNGIAKLHNLRHLLVRDIDEDNSEGFNYGNGVAAPANIYNLKDLQILEGVEANAGLMKQVRNMTQLKRLAIYNVKETEQEDLFNSIQGMKLLTLLLVKVSDEAEYLRTDTLSSAPPCLGWLKLAGKLERVPSWFRSFESLKRLILNWSRLREDPLQYIHALPNLEVLILNNAYAGRQLCFSTGFCKLKGLGLNNMAELNEIIIERGTMPDVKELRLQRCMELKMLPRGIQFLTNLETLRLSMVRDELIQGIEIEGSLDRQNVQHIPHITYYDKEIGHRKIVVTDNMKK